MYIYRVYFLPSLLTDHEGGGPREGGCGVSVLCASSSLGEERVSPDGACLYIFDFPSSTRGKVALTRAE